MAPGPQVSATKRSRNSAAVTPPGHGVLALLLAMSAIPLVR